MFLNFLSKFRSVNKISPQVEKQKHTIAQPKGNHEVLDLTPGRPLRIYSKAGEFRDISTDELVGQRRNNFKNWLCGMGAESLYVSMDGDVFGASCRVLGKLGNVFEDFKIPEKWINCPVELCTCGADLFIPKAKSKSDISLLRKSFGKEPEVEKKVPEISAMYGMERTHAASEKQIYWEIGRRCNYDCTYCWPMIHNNHEAFKPLADLLSATDRILEKFAKGNLVNFIISGGEPTLNPDFMQWVKYISKLGHNLSMHSNGSRLPEYYRELIHHGSLNISVHFESYKKDRMLKVISAITDEKVKCENIGVGHLEVKIMMAPGRRREAQELFSDLNRIPNFQGYCTSAFVPIRDGKNGDQIMAGYDQEDFDLFGEGKVDQPIQEQTKVQ